ncbi:thioredoxin-related protein [Pedobacter africanus]|uniref:Thioredoxin-related protein n=1 Tax=Pedobacter africanus TaxID=151894 RepID=A0ACC6KZK7_9SPHI|nr:thioredoxin family protein [Pedobacter africanus]MDR6784518.1 thioredoxin-related protein [Pedobacter africanus]
MKKMILAAALLWCSVSYAQNRSINFETTSLKEAFKLAKERGKMIFVDCYTVWCVPCKGMEKLVFSQDSVADFFNSHFINVKLDMEKGEGPAALKTYSIGAFPTYLLFDREGKEIYKFVGGMPANEFMAKIRIGMNPENEAATREKRYAAGDRDHALLRGLIVQRFRQKDAAAGTALAREYYNMLSPAEKTRPENWFLFGEGYDSRYMSEIGSINFNYLLENYAAFVAANGKEKVDAKINYVFTWLAKNCLASYYFKNHPFDRAEFEKFKQQIQSSQVPGKKELLVLVDIAIGAGEKNPGKVGKLLARYVDGFSAQSQSVVIDYTSFCTALGRSYPYIQEISQKIKKTSKNDILIRFCEDYASRVVAKKNGKNE